MNKKEAYEPLEMETIRFLAEDVIITSGEYTLEGLELPLDGG